MRVSSKIFRPVFAIAAVAGFQLGADAATAGNRVLFLGDSFSMGAFGQVLDSRMRESGIDLFTVVAGGASPYYWLKAYQPLPCAIGVLAENPRQ